MLESRTTEPQCLLTNKIIIIYWSPLISRLPIGSSNWFPSTDQNVHDPHLSLESSAGSFRHAQWFSRRALWSEERFVHWEIIVSTLKPKVTPFMELMEYLTRQPMIAVTMRRSLWNSRARESIVRKVIAWLLLIASSDRPRRLQREHQSSSLPLWSALLSLVQPIVR